MKQVIVIPARMGGGRLPGKPLIDILGKPMIYRVWKRCTQVFPENQIYIATENNEISEYCKKMSINCVMTKKSETAIDRIKHFSDVISADTYINVQGDEPIINLADIKTISNYCLKYPERVVFGKVKANEVEFNDISKAKVVCDINGKLLYSSRAGIPVTREGKFVSAERAIWIYGFPKSALEGYFEARFKSKIDRIEDNEIIRFIEFGIPVYCVDVIGNSWAVDEPKDVDIVKKLILSDPSLN